MSNDPVNNVIKAMIQRGQQQWIEGMKEAEDTCYYCRNCGHRSKLRGEVRQEERDETCLYVCTICNEIVDEIPF
jgi:hypothetical protein